MGRIIRETQKHFNPFAPYGAVDYLRTVVYYKTVFVKIPLFTYVKSPSSMRVKEYPMAWSTRADGGVGTIDWAQKNPIYYKNFHYFSHYEILDKRKLNELKQK